MTTNITKSLIESAVQEILNAKSLGINQTYQNVIASRALATTYTNNTGKPIHVLVSAQHSASTSSEFLVNGTIVATSFSGSGTSYRHTYSVIVPNASTYRINQTGGTITLSNWAELR